MAPSGKRACAEHSRLSAIGAALRYAIELLLQAREVVIREPLEIHEARSRTLGRAQQLVQLELQRPGVAVLRVLQQKCDEKRDLRRERVHRQLPRIRKMH